MCFYHTSHSKSHRTIACFSDSPSLKVDIDVLSHAALVFIFVHPILWLDTVMKQVVLVVMYIFLWFMFGVHVWIVVLWLDSSVIGVILVWLILWMKNDWTNVAKKRIFLAILLGENKIPISAVLIEVLLAVWTWLDFQSLSCQVLSSFSK